MSRVAASMPKGVNIQAPKSASNTNSGTVNKDPHSASQVACEAFG